MRDTFTRVGRWVHKRRIRSSMCKNGSSNRWLLSFQLCYLWHGVCSGERGRAYQRSLCYVFDEWWNWPWCWCCCRRRRGNGRASKRRCMRLNIWGMPILRFFRRIILESPSCPVDRGVGQVVRWRRTGCIFIWRQRLQQSLFGRWFANPMSRWYAMMARWTLVTALTGRWW